MWTILRKPRAGRRASDQLRELRERCCSALGCRKIAIKIEWSARKKNKRAKNASEKMSLVRTDKSDRGEESQQQMLGIGGDCRETKGCRVSPRPVEVASPSVPVPVVVVASIYRLKSNFDSFHLPVIRARGPCKMRRSRCATSRYAMYMNDILIYSERTHQCGIKAFFGIRADAAAFVRAERPRDERGEERNENRRTSGGQAHRIPSGVGKV